MSIKNRLTQEVAYRIDELRGLDVNSAEYKTGVDAVSKMIDRLIEMDKIDIEDEVREDARKKAKFEEETRTREMADERLDRLVKNILTGVSIGGGILLAIWGTNKTIRFEETGTYTTTAGRKFASRLFSWVR